MAPASADFTLSARWPPPVVLLIVMAAPELAVALTFSPFTLEPAAL